MTPNFCKRTTRIWIWDYNLCDRWEDKTETNFVGQLERKERFSRVI